MALSLLYDFSRIVSRSRGRETLEVAGTDQPLWFVRYWLSGTPLAVPADFATTNDHVGLLLQWEQAVPDVVRSVMDSVNQRLNLLREIVEEIRIHRQHSDRWFLLLRDVALVPGFSASVDLGIAIEKPRFVVKLCREPVQPCLQHPTRTTSVEWSDHVMEDYGRFPVPIAPREMELHAAFSLLRSAITQANMAERKNKLLARYSLGLVGCAEVLPQPPDRGLCFEFVDRVLRFAREYSVLEHLAQTTLTVLPSRPQLAFEIIKVIIQHSNRCDDALLHLLQLAFCAADIPVQLKLLEWLQQHFTATSHQPALECLLALHQAAEVHVQVQFRDKIEPGFIARSVAHFGSVELLRSALQSSNVHHQWLGLLARALATKYHFHVFLDLLPFSNLQTTLELSVDTAAFEPLLNCCADAPTVLSRWRQLCSKAQPLFFLFVHLLSRSATSLQPSLARVAKDSICFEEFSITTMAAEDLQTLNKLSHSDVSEVSESASAILLTVSSVPLPSCLEFLAKISDDRLNELLVRGATYLPATSVERLTRFLLSQQRAAMAVQQLCNSLSSLVDSNQDAEEVARIVRLMLLGLRRSDASYPLFQQNLRRGFQWLSSENDLRVRLIGLELIAMHFNFPSEWKLRMQRLIGGDPKTTSQTALSVNESDHAELLSLLFPSQTGSHLTSESFSEIAQRVKDDLQFATQSCSLPSITRLETPHLASLFSQLDTADFEPGAQGQYPRFRCPEAFRAQIPTDTGMVITPTVQRNIESLFSALVTETPWLLEGDTGVGKTATVTEAARLIGMPLVRFNMSDNLTIGDFVGLVEVSPDGGNGPTVRFRVGPFTDAFVTGKWLLLDEANLAPATVLQAIENAIDSEELRVADDSDASQRDRVFYRHKHFRLFVTQNPATGLFKSHRQPLPQSFVSRLQRHSFDALPPQEWRAIVRSRLASRLASTHETPILDVAERMVSLHMEIQARFAALANNPDIAAFCAIATVTMRELLRWVDGIVWLTLQRNSGGAQLDLEQVLSHEGLAIYGARFPVFCGRPQGAGLSAMRDSVRRILGINYNVPRLEMQQLAGEPCLQVDQYILSSRPSNGAGLLVESRITLPGACARHLMEVHQKIRQFSMHQAFVERFGLVPIDDRTMLRIARVVYDLAHRVGFSPSQLCESITSCYVGLFQSQEARSEVSMVLGVPECESTLTHDLPLILSSRILATLPHLVRAISLREPVLLIGSTASGKSKLISTLAAAANVACRHFCITADTEPNELVGQTDPRTLQWSNGVVTEAIVQDQWLVLDNLDEAEAVVLERLNPLLEARPFWALSEKGDTEPIDVQSSTNFRLFATLCPDSISSRERSNISPALANRFTIIYLSDLDIESDGQEEISQILESTLCHTNYQGNRFGRTTLQPRSLGSLLAEGFCRSTRQLAKESDFVDQNMARRFNLRTIVRMAQCTLEVVEGLRTRASPIGIVDILLHTFNTAVIQQLTGRAQEIVRREFETTMGWAKHVQVAPVDFLRLLCPTLQEQLRESRLYILDATNTPTRFKFAQAVALCISCNKPILLEGPPAAGKTALVEVLSRPEMGATNRPLMRVNNTDTTSLHDYFGTYLPEASPGSSGIPEFVFCPGALTVAMTEGLWFLSDEINLADPSILSALAPVLEGAQSVMIPNTSIVVQIKEGFRFFATQNDSRFAGRKKLPAKLRSLFLEAQVTEIPPAELQFILKERFEHLDDTSARQLEQLYLRVNKAIDTQTLSFGDPSVRLTLREINKIVLRARRHKILSMADCAWILLFPRLRHESLIDELRKCVSDAFGKSERDLPNLERLSLQEDPAGEKVIFWSGTRPLLEVPGSLKRLSNMKAEAMTTPFIRSLLLVSFAASVGEPVLLVGPTTCKSEVVRVWEEMVRPHGSDSNLEVIYLTSETESADLMGQIRPFQVLDAARHLLSQWNTLLVRSHIAAECKIDRERLQGLEAAIGEVEREFECLQMELQKEDNQQEEREHREAGFLSNGDEVISPIFAEAPASRAVMDDFAANSTMLGDFLDDSFTMDDDDAPFLDSNPLTNQFVSDPFAAFDNYDSEVPDPFAPEEDSSEPHFSLENLEKETDDASFDHPDPFSQFEPLDERDQPETVDDTMKVDPMDPFLRVLTTEVPRNTEAKEQASTLLSALFGKGGAVQRLELMLEGLPLDSGAQIIFHSCQQLRRQLEHANLGEGLFLFADGTVTLAAKLAKPMLLENIDAPPQSVVERLNSLLEGERTFSLIEDITLTQTKSVIAPRIELLPSFQVFATVYSSSSTIPLGLSPALRSRFTEIFIRSFSTTELQEIAQESLKDFPQADRTQLLRFLFSVVDFLVRNHVSVSVRDVVSVCRATTSFTFAHAQEYRAHAALTALVLAIRFVLLDAVVPAIRRQLVDHLKKELSATEMRDHLLYLDNVATPVDLENPFVLSVTCKPDGSLLYQSLSLRHIPTICCRVLDPYEDTEDLERAVRMGSRLNPSRDFRRFRPLQPTPTLAENMARLLAAVVAKRPLLLEGPPGIGKTAIVMNLGSLIGQQHVVRINFSDSTTREQLFGSFVPQIKNGQRSFRWQDGSIVRGLRVGAWIVFDEINLACSEVLEEITQLLVAQEQQQPGKPSAFKLSATGEQLALQPQTAFFATMNPSTIGGGRSKLPRSLDDQFQRVTLENMTDEELLLIVLQLAHRMRVLDDGDNPQLNTISSKMLTQVFEAQQQLQESISKRLIGHQGGPFALNLRDLEAFLAVLAGSGRFFAAEAPGISDTRVRGIQFFAHLIYASRFHSIAEQQQARALINGKLGVSESPINTEIVEEQDYVTIGSVVVPKGSGRSEGEPLVPTRRTLEALQILATGVQSHRGILLEGPTCSGKTALVKELARLCRRRLLVLSMNEDTEVSDMMGQYAAVSFERAKELLHSKLETLLSSIVQLAAETLPACCEKELAFDGLLEMCTSLLECQATETRNIEQLFELVESLAQKLVDSFEDNSAEIIVAREAVKELKKTQAELRRVEEQASGLSFQFAEGEFVRALRRGDWILLDNINRAHGEVVERLNSLLEDSATLALTEQGEGELLSRGNGIHPEAQIFATATTVTRGQAGACYSLSTALKNRMISVWLPSLDSGLEVATIAHHELRQVGSRFLMHVHGYESVLNVLLRMYIESRELVARHRLENEVTLTVRTVFQALRSVQVGRSGPSGLVQAAISCFVNLFPQVELRGHLLQFLAKILQREDVIVSSFTTAPPVRSFQRPIDSILEQLTFRTISLARECLAVAFHYIQTVPAISVNSDPLLPVIEVIYSIVSKCNSEYVLKAWRHVLQVWNDVKERQRALDSAIVTSSSELDVPNSIESCSINSSSLLLRGVIIQLHDQVSISNAGEVVNSLRRVSVALEKIYNLLELLDYLPSLDNLRDSLTALQEINSYVSIAMQHFHLLSCDSLHQLQGQVHALIRKELEVTSGSGEMRQYQDLSIGAAMLQCYLRVPVTSRNRSWQHAAEQLCFQFATPPQCILRFVEHIAFSSSQFLAVTRAASLGLLNTGRHELLPPRSRLKELQLRFVTQKALAELAPAIISCRNSLASRLSCESVKHVIEKALGSSAVWELESSHKVNQLSNLSVQLSRFSKTLVGCPELTRALVADSELLVHLCTLSESDREAAVEVLVCTFMGNLWGRITNGEVFLEMVQQYELVEAIARILDSHQGPTVIVVAAPMLDSHHLGAEGVIVCEQLAPAKLRLHVYALDPEPILQTLNSKEKPYVKIKRERLELSSEMESELMRGCCDQRLLAMPHLRAILDGLSWPFNRRSPLSPRAFAAREYETIVKQQEAMMRAIGAQKQTQACQTSFRSVHLHDQVLLLLSHLKTMSDSLQAASEEDGTRLIALFLAEPSSLLIDRLPELESSLTREIDSLMPKDNVSSFLAAIKATGFSVFERLIASICNSPEYQRQSAVRTSFEELFRSQLLIHNRLASFDFVSSCGVPVLSNMCDVYSSWLALVELLAYSIKVSHDGEASLSCHASHLVGQLERARSAVAATLEKLDTIVDLESIMSFSTMSLLRSAFPEQTASNEERASHSENPKSSPICPSPISQQISTFIKQIKKLCRIAKENNKLTPHLNATLLKFAAELRQQEKVLTTADLPQLDANVRYLQQLVEQAQSELPKSRSRLGDFQPPTSVATVKEELDSANYRPTVEMNVSREPVSEFVVKCRSQMTDCTALGPSTIAISAPSLGQAIRREIGTEMWSAIYREFRRLGIDTMETDDMLQQRLAQLASYTSSFDLGLRISQLQRGHDRNLSEELSRDFSADLRKGLDGERFVDLEAACRPIGDMLSRDTTITHSIELVEALETRERALLTGVSQLMSIPPALAAPAHHSISSPCLSFTEAVVLVFPELGSVALELRAHEVSGMGTEFSVDWETVSASIRRCSDRLALAASFPREWDGPQWLIDDTCARDLVARTFSHYSVASSRVSQLPKPSLPHRSPAFAVFVVASLVSNVNSLLVLSETTVMAHRGRSMRKEPKNIFDLRELLRQLNHSHSTAIEKQKATTGSSQKALEEALEQHQKVKQRLASSANKDHAGILLNLDALGKRIECLRREYEEGKAQLATLEREQQRDEPRRRDLELEISNQIEAAQSAHVERLISDWKKLSARVMELLLSLCYRVDESSSAVRDPMSIVTSDLTWPLQLIESVLAYSTSPEGSPAEYRLLDQSTFETKCSELTAEAVRLFDEWKEELPSEHPSYCLLSNLPRLWKAALDSAKISLAMLHRDIPVTFAPQFSSALRELRTWSETRYAYLVDRDFFELGTETWQSLLESLEQQIGPIKQQNSVSRAITTSTTTLVRQLFVAAKVKSDLDSGSRPTLTSAEMHNPELLKLADLQLVELQQFMRRAKSRLLALFKCLEHLGYFVARKLLPDPEILLEETSQLCDALAYSVAPIALQSRRLFFVLDHVTEGLMSNGITERERELVETSHRELLSIVQYRVPDSIYLERRKTSQAMGEMLTQLEEHAILLHSTSLELLIHCRQSRSAATSSFELLHQSAAELAKLIVSIGLEAAETHFCETLNDISTRFTEGPLLVEDEGERVELDQRTILLANTLNLDELLLRIRLDTLSPQLDLARLRVALQGFQAVALLIESGISTSRAAALEIFSTSLSVSAACVVHPVGAFHRMCQQALEGLGANLFVVAANEMSLAKGILRRLESLRSETLERHLATLCAEQQRLHSSESGQGEVVQRSIACLDSYLEALRKAIDTHLEQLFVGYKEDHRRAVEAYERRKREIEEENERRQRAYSKSVERCANKNAKQLKKLEEAKRSLKETWSRVGSTTQTGALSRLSALFVQLNSLSSKYDIPTVVLQPSLISGKIRVDATLSQGFWEAVSALAKTVISLAGLGTQKLFLIITHRNITTTSPFVPSGTSYRASASRALELWPDAESVKIAVHKDGSILRQLDFHPSSPGRSLVTTRDRTLVANIVTENEIKPLPPINLASEELAPDRKSLPDRLRTLENQVNRLKPPVPLPTEPVLVPSIESVTLLPERRIEEDRKLLYSVCSSCSNFVAQLKAAASEGNVEALSERSKDPLVTGGRLPESLRPRIEPIRREALGLFSAVLQVEVLRAAQVSLQHRIACLNISTLAQLDEFERKASVEWQLDQRLAVLQRVVSGLPNALPTLVELRKASALGNCVELLGSLRAFMQQRQRAGTYFKEASQVVPPSLSVEVANVIGSHHHQSLYIEDESFGSIDVEVPTQLVGFTARSASLQLHNHASQRACISIDLPPECPVSVHPRLLYLDSGGTGVVHFECQTSEPLEPTCFGARLIVKIGVSQELREIEVRVSAAVQSVHLDIDEGIVDFGRCNKGRFVKYLTISNRTAVPLRLRTAIASSYSSGEDQTFSVGWELYDLSPGASIGLSVSASVARPGEYRACLRVLTKTTEKSIPLQIICEPPALQLLDKQERPVEQHHKLPSPLATGVVHREYFLVRNTSSYPVTYQGNLRTVMQYVKIVGSHSAVLQPGSTARLELELSHRGPNRVSNTIELVADDKAVAYVMIEALFEVPKITVKAESALCEKVDWATIPTGGAPPVFSFPFRVSNISRCAATVRLLSETPGNELVVDAPSEFVVPGCNAICVQVKVQAVAVVVGTQLLSLAFTCKGQTLCHPFSIRLDCSNVFVTLSSPTVNLGYVRQGMSLVDQSLKVRASHPTTVEVRHHESALTAPATLRISPGQPMPVLVEARPPALGEFCYRVTVVTQQRAIDDDGRVFKVQVPIVFFGVALAPEDELPTTEASRLPKALPSLSSDTLAFLIKSDAEEIQSKAREELMIDGDESLLLGIAHAFPSLACLFGDSHSAEHGFLSSMSFLVREVPVPNRFELYEFVRSLLVPGNRVNARELGIHVMHRCSQLLPRGSRPRVALELLLSWLSDSEKDLLGSLACAGLLPDGLMVMSDTSCCGVGLYYRRSVLRSACRASSIYDYDCRYCPVALEGRNNQCSSASA